MEVINIAEEELGLGTLTPRNIGLVVSKYGRYQLKNKRHYQLLREIVRIGNTQKIITTSDTNTHNKIITTTKCSESNDNLKDIYTALKTKHQPFTKRKSVAHKLKFKKKTLLKIRYFCLDNYKMG